MTQKNQAGNILPIIIIIGLILGAGYLLMGDDFKLPNLFNKNPKIERVEGFPKTVYVTQDREKLRRVIKSEEELNQFLNEVDESNQIDFNAKINFNKKYVIAAATKTMAEDGHKFKIEKIYKDTKDKSLKVNLVVWNPSDQCMDDYQKDPNIMIDLAQIDKTDWEINFDLEQKTLPCDNQ